MEIFINQLESIPLKEIATFILSVVGLIIAGMGLATWKKQIRGSKQFETAYNLHYSVLKLRDAIKHVRNPAIFPSETQRAVQYSKNKYPDRSPEDIENKANVYVYEMRWEEIARASTELESHLLSAEVLWGPEVLKLIKPLNKKVTELNINLGQYFNKNLRTKDYMKIHDVVYDQSDPTVGTEDKFSGEVSEAVKGITDYVRNKMA
ncbi:hypothetical protein IT397_02780 [Candidatus Nomurabacteria bacterium]|nr:hypothetical protein [Candidatus Nomurabacteria bacterium]